jgi:hypothetical protein
MRREPELLIKGDALFLSVLLAASGCGLDLAGTSAPTGNVGQDAGAAGSDATAPNADAAGGVAPQPQGSSAEAGSCLLMCGSTCVPNCNGCLSGNYECQGKCVTGCDQCGSQFVVCLVCAGGGPMTRICSSSDPSGCLGGAYDHCPCTGNNDCPEGNQRCSEEHGVCAACGEQLFDGDECNNGGKCCEAPSLGLCTCTPG